MSDEILMKIFPFILSKDVSSTKWKNYRYSSVLEGNLTHSIFNEATHLSDQFLTNF